MGIETGGVGLRPAGDASMSVGDADRGRGVSGRAIRGVGVFARGEPAAAGSPWPFPGAPTSVTSTCVARGSRTGDARRTPTVITRIM